MIGIFDSGLGGLTVAKSVFKHLGQYQVMYYGDTARVPYGNRSPKTVYEFTREGVDFLFQQGCQLVILACNTATAESLRQLQQEWLPKHYPEKRILGVVRPLVEHAATFTKNKKVGVIGTRGTIVSKAYIRELHAMDKNIKVFQKATPLLVPLIEEAWIHRQEAKKIMRYYMRSLKNTNIDTLILGCTHYQIIHSDIQNIMGKRCTVLDSGKIVATSLKEYLDRHPEIEQKLVRGKDHVYYVTDITENFQTMAYKWLGKKITLKKNEVL